MGSACALGVPWTFPASQTMAFLRLVYDTVYDTVCVPVTLSCTPHSTPLLPTCPNLSPPHPQAEPELLPSLFSRLDHDRDGRLTPDQVGWPTKPL